jgi:hypothetical protein
MNPILSVLFVIAARIPKYIVICAVSYFIATILEINPMLFVVGIIIINSITYIVIIFTNITFNKLVPYKTVAGIQDIVKYRCFSLITSIAEPLLLIIVMFVLAQRFFFPHKLFKFSYELERALDPLWKSTIALVIVAIASLVTVTVFFQIVTSVGELFFKGNSSASGMIRLPKNAALTAPHKEGQAKKVVFLIGAYIVTSMAVFTWTYLSPSVQRPSDISGLGQSLRYLSNSSPDPYVSMVAWSFLITAEFALLAISRSEF